MGFFAVILFIILAIVISFVQGESHERKITEQIESMNSRVILSCNLEEVFQSGFRLLY